MFGEFAEFFQLFVHLVEFEYMLEKNRSIIATYLALFCVFEHEI